MVVRSDNMASRNAKQPRSQQERLSPPELDYLKGLIERAQANDQLEDVLVRAQVMSVSDVRNKGREGSPGVSEFSWVGSRGSLSKSASPMRPAARNKVSSGYAQPSSNASGSSTADQLLTTATLVQSAMEETYVLPTTTNSVLPRGVPDIHTWARTLFELPKLKDRRWSYGRLCREAYNDIDLISYVKWLMLN